MVFKTGSNCSQRFSSRRFLKFLDLEIPFLLQSLFCQVFPIKKKKTARGFSKIITELAKPHSVALSM